MVRTTLNQRWTELRAWRHVHVELEDLLAQPVAHLVARDHRPAIGGSIDHADLAHQIGQQRQVHQVRLGHRVEPERQLHPRALHRADHRAERRHAVDRPGQPPRAHSTQGLAPLPATNCTVAASPTAPETQAT